MGQSRTRDLVCLPRARSAWEARGHPTVTPTRRLDFYQKPRDGAPEVAKVSVKQLEEWAQETEMTGAAARAGGTWRVQAASVGSRDDARALIRALRAAGFPAEAVAAPDGSFKVQVPGLGGEAEARALMARIRDVKGVSLPEVLQGR